MNSLIKRSGLGFALTRTLPATLLALAVGAAMFLLLLWSSNEADRASFDRQQQLFNLVVSQMRSQLGHDQESSTVWDEAVEMTRAGDAEWMDLNVGSWMHTYFGHDGAYVLDPSDKAIYSFADGAVAGPDAYGDIEEEVDPLADRLRATLRAGDDSGVTDMILSPGVADIVVAEGHPAVVSVKPIVSDSGEIEQVPGEQYLHVALRYLDGAFLNQITEDYLFDGLRFSWTDTKANNEAAHALVNSAGETIGYFLWQPYRPGSAVFAAAAPPLAGVLGLFALAIIGFMTTVHVRSLRLRVSEERIRHMAMHDALTGLANRSQFEERVDRVLGVPRHDAIALLYLDLDRFKQVNDTLGHLVGDMLIREFADRLKGLVREGDVVARIGGDEFTVMLVGVSGRAEVEPLCERIVDFARKPFDIGGNRVFIGVSIGVAMAPEDGAGRIDLLRKADVALYHSKSTGRGRYSFFETEMDETIRERRAIEQDLREALQAGGQLMTHFQPIYSATTRRLTGVEALLRWNHPDRGFIGPELFIPIAEEVGLIEELGELVLRETLAASSNWPEITISINVSPVELSNPAYAIRIASELMACGLDPRRLEIEITETSATDGSGIAAHNLDRLRELGVRIAIDDFGTGFSSLGRLQQLKVDRVKIDKSFIHGFGRATDDEVVVQAIIDIAHAKGLKTTAEGVETDGQSQDLARFGCDDLQGFLYAHAVPSSEIDRIVGLDAEDLPATGTAD